MDNAFIILDKITTHLTKKNQKLIIGLDGKNNYGISFFEEYLAKNPQTLLEVKINSSCISEFYEKHQGEDTYVFVNTGNFYIFEDLFKYHGGFLEKKNDLNFHLDLTVPPEEFYGHLYNNESEAYLFDSEENINEILEVCYEYILEDLENYHPQSEL